MHFDPEKITYFAQTDARGQAVRFGIKAKDRQRHMYVIGKTGMGKSTLLENMAVQDIQNGEGMAFIDPHGSAAETLLEYIPEHRINDVVYFAPFDMDHPIAFNVMEDVGADKRHLVVSGLMSTFKKIWVDAWSARMEYILTNALLALIEYPDTTLLSVTRLFVDKAYREKVVDYIQDPAVKSFWVDEFANYTDRFAAEALPAIQNKIGQFTGNPLIRNIIGQPKSSFNIRELMDNRKILIMNLSKGLVGETNANLLGSMLTTRIYLAAMSRADLPVETMKQMPNFYFYVDEFQSFANSTFSNILSEARKYHLNLIIAHQYIEQMEEEVKDAVFGNVGTTVTFRVGPFDAEVLETVFTPRFLAPDLVNLGFAQIYLTLMIDGVGSAPFSAVTLPPIETPAISYKRMVVAASRKNYANERAPIEKLVAELHTPTLPQNSKKEQPKNSSNRKQQSFGNKGAGKHNQSVAHDYKVSKNNGTSSPSRSNNGTLPANQSAESKSDSTSLKAVLNQVRKDSDHPPVKQVTESSTTKQSLLSVSEVKKTTSQKFSQHKKDYQNNKQTTSRVDDTTQKDSNEQLQELRSVLAKLATRELKGNENKEHEQTGKKFTPKKQNHTDKSQSKPKEMTPAKDDLRQVLQNVLHSGGGKTEASSAQPREISSLAAQAETANNKKLTAGNNKTTTSAPDPLDPALLQKILKKGGSSQPPYA